ncbi:hypothetical protein TNCV_630201 [Trichonephila clavipes]|nr:hypothetical protein TNCV_630201 [Trichonephila clavipes]
MAEIFGIPILQPLGAAKDTAMDNLMHVKGIEAKNSHVGVEVWREVANSGEIALPTVSESGRCNDIDRRPLRGSDCGG